MEIDIETINDIVELSFGKGFRGNMCIKPGLLGRIESRCYMNEIAKRITIVPNCVYYLKYAGKFTEKNGSVLEVDPKYLKFAINYAIRYKERTGDTITLINKKTKQPIDLAQLIQNKRI